jgi:alginate O-acetyltransferase complex protein AlgI
MIFNTWTYGFFLAVVFAVYWLAPIRWRAQLLVAAGAYFYWYYYPPHLVLIAIATLLVWGASFLVQPGAGRRRRLVFTIAASACIGMLTYYKYQGFLADSLNWTLGVVGVSSTLKPPELRPPLAISFFVFEYVHYLIEVYRGTFAPTGLKNFILFIMFFPTLICGPIKRFQLFNPGEYARRRLDPVNVHAGLERILFGISKKTLIADAVAPYCLPVFANPDAYTTGQLWLGVYGYAMQIYFDFSGYSDIAIGSAKLLGFPVPENFNYPYLQPDIARFWRSWHMSLTSWITDYVYIPLGGNRQGELRAAWNRFLSMTICGLWHGAAFHFMVWGMYHGLALNLYRFWQKGRERLFGSRTGTASLLARSAGALLTFHVVCIGWVLFVCDLGKAVGIIGRLLLLHAAPAGG